VGEQSEGGRVDGSNRRKLLGESRVGAHAAPCGTDQSEGGRAELPGRSLGSGWLDHDGLDTVWEG
jgi:hypothetical protein